MSVDDTPAVALTVDCSIIDKCSKLAWQVPSFFVLKAAFIRLKSHKLKASDIFAVEVKNASSTNTWKELFENGGLSETSDIRIMDYATYVQRYGAAADLEGHRPLSPLGRNYCSSFRKLANPVGLKTLNDSVTEFGQRVFIFESFIFFLFVKTGKLFTSKIFNEIALPSTAAAVEAPVPVGPNEEQAYGAPDTRGPVHERTADSIVECCSSFAGKAVNKAAIRDYLKRGLPTLRARGDSRPDTNDMYMYMLPESRDDDAAVLSRERCSKLQKKEEAVCHLHVEGIGRATAFSISPGYIATALHTFCDNGKGGDGKGGLTTTIISSETKITLTWPNETTREFELGDTICYPVFNKERKRVDVALDIAILKLPEPLNSDAVCIPLLDYPAPRLVYPDKPMYKLQAIHLIHYPSEPSGSADPTLVNGFTDTNRRITGCEDFEIFYGTSTEHGSSGAPGLDLDGKLLCVHRAGGQAKLPGQRAYFNVGVRVDFLLHREFGFKLPECTEKVIVYPLLPNYTNLLNDLIEDGAISINNG